MAFPYSDNVSIRLGVILRGEAMERANCPECEERGKPLNKAQRAALETVDDKTLDQMHWCSQCGLYYAAKPPTWIQRLYRGEWVECPNKCGCTSVKDFYFFALSRFRDAYDRKVPQEEPVVLFRCDNQVPTCGVFWRGKIRLCAYHEDKLLTDLLPTDIGYTRLPSDGWGGVKLWGHPIENVSH